MQFSADGEKILGVITTGNYNFKKPEEFVIHVVDARTLKIEQKTRSSNLSGPKGYNSRSAMIHFLGFAGNSKDEALCEFQNIGGDAAQGFGIMRMSLKKRKLETLVRLDGRVLTSSASVSSDGSTATICTGDFHIGYANPKVRIIDLKTGASIASNSLPSAGQLLASSDNGIAIVRLARKLVAINVATGEDLASTPCDGTAVGAIDKLGRSMLLLQANSNKESLE